MHVRWSGVNENCFVGADGSSARVTEIAVPQQPRQGRITPAILRNDPAADRGAEAAEFMSRPCQWIHAGERTASRPDVLPLVWRQSTAFITQVVRNSEWNAAANSRDQTTAV